MSHLSAPVIKKTTGIQIILESSSADMTVLFTLSSADKFWNSANVGITAEVCGCHRICKLEKVTQSIQETSSERKII